MGIDPIEYTPWSEKKTVLGKRFLVMVKKIFRQNIKSKAIWAILIIGSILVHVFPILTAALTPSEELTANTMRNYLSGDIFFLFTVLLATVICSGLISQDLKDNSFVLYFSRPLKTETYLLGKMGGAFLTLLIYCFIPPMLVGISVTATQTGNVYTGSLEVLAKTAVAGLLTSFVFLPFILLLSSLTKRKAYAGIGAFMGIYALTLVSFFFDQFDPNWKLLSPSNLLHFTYDLIFGFGLPDNIDAGLYSASMILLILLPLILLFYRIRSKEVGG
ncbi:MAG: ABC transporter permease subunit [Candidatus Thermoplasmatota archaeon]